MTIDTFIEYNFAPFIGVVFQVIILLFSHNFSKKERTLFIITICLEVLELVAYNLEFMYAERTSYSIWRVIYSVIGYITRPALVYPFVLLLRPKFTQKHEKLWYLDLIPLALVIIIQQFAFFTKWVFYFDQSNTFHRGPLGYISQAVTIFYVVEASFFLMIDRFQNKKFNVALIAIIMIYVILAMVFESIFNIRSLGISSAVFSIVFFMFFTMTNSLNDITEKLKDLSEVDFLSKLYNRYAGEKKVNEIILQEHHGAFLILDIDNFKKINDTFGHASGDQIIEELANVIQKRFQGGDINVRLGGDEFSIFTTRYSALEDIKKDIDLFFEDIDKITLAKDKDYRMHVSVGMASLKKGEIKNFDSLYKEADMKLYEAKKHFGNYLSY